MPLYGGAASADELEDQRDHGQHKKDVNETTHRVAANNAEQPQNQQNYEQSPKHVLTLADRKLTR
jgi:hypothetical protein